MRRLLLDKQVAHKRHVANEVARQGARETGVLFMDTSGWQTSPG